MDKCARNLIFPVLSAGIVLLLPSFQVNGLPRRSNRALFSKSSTFPQNPFIQGLFPATISESDNRIDLPESSNGCLSPRGIFPGRSCNTYVNCWNGVPLEQDCPSGLFFNVEKNYCDYPENVQCSIARVPLPLQQASPTASPPVPPTTPSSSSSTSTRDLQKRCLKARGQFPSDSCDRYVNCWDGSVVEEQCPEGLVFSAKGYCDYPHNAECGDNRQNAAAATVTECPRADGTFRDAKNCSNYFTCIDGLVVARYTCPENFAFNYNIGVCDYAERVDCNQEPPAFQAIRTDILQKIPKDFLQRLENCITGTVFRLNPECTIAGICRVGLTEIVECPSGYSYDSRTDKSDKSRDLNSSREVMAGRVVEVLQT